MRKLEWDDMGMKVDGRQLHRFADLRFADDIYKRQCRELNMMNDLTPELGRRKRAPWGAYKTIEHVLKKTKNIRLRAHFFNTKALPVLTYAPETWAARKQEENPLLLATLAIGGALTSRLFENQRERYSYWL
ncbi:hypothetical protein RB195_014682 [Necator americanus]|uniref:Uncharacterized protein n=1 Tax=Necator americanus TaxID=51031 RepID=A0ABR1E3X8_NECAM